MKDLSETGRYQQMSESKKFEFEVLPSPWLHLKPHAERDHVVIVEASLDLLEVGRAVVANDTVRIELLISAGHLKKPSREQLETWDQEPTREFLMIIAQPWVLIQERLD
jgi:hypothetical protein